MFNVFFLLAQEVVTDIVQAVASQFVVTQNNLKQLILNAIKICDLPEKHQKRFDHPNQLACSGEYPFAPTKKL